MSEHEHETNGTGATHEALARLLADAGREFYGRGCARGAGAILHTHSVWSTLLSEAFAAEGRVVIEGFEMLKGLAGVRTHEHRELLPVIDNSQDMDALSRSLEEALERYPEA